MRYTAVISSLAVKAADVLVDGFDTVLLPPDRDIAMPISCHADMILFTFGDLGVLPSSYADQYPDTVERLEKLTGISLVADGFERSDVYPHDVGLNVLICSDIAFSRVAYTSPCVKDILSQSGIRHVDIRQGYAACSSLSFGSAIITADRGVASAAEGEGGDVLLISPYGITLPGYDMGFIGGASGVCERVVYFLGNIDCHPDAEKIRAFIKKHGFECVSLYDGPLCDYGGIKFIKNRT